MAVDWTQMKDGKLLYSEIQKPFLGPRLQSARIILKGLLLIRVLKDLPEMKFVSKDCFIALEFLKAVIDTNDKKPFGAEHDSRPRYNQAGFRAGRGCADQIFTLRRILEFRHGYQKPTAVCFIDFAAAFDSVHHESLWRIMTLDGVPPQLITIIKAYYRPPSARFLIRNSLSQPFAIRSGVRQGCILSPIFFNYAIDRIHWKAQHEGDGVEFAPGHRLTDLDYADAIALLASSFGGLQSMVTRVNKVAKSVDLSTNVGKLKVFSCCIPDQEKALLGIAGD
nr:unnamed protein product [Spirometra erinaceieuropaei]